MAQITKDLIIDVAKKNLRQAIVAKQNDINSRFLRVTLCNEGDKIEVPSNATVLINAERADGESNAFSGTVNADGTATVPITAWMLKLDDVVKCSISIFDTDDEKLTSTSFSIDVEASEYDGDEVTEDDNCDILTNLISDCSEAVQKCESAALLCDTVTSLFTSIDYVIYSGTNVNITASGTPISLNHAVQSGEWLLITTNGQKYLTEYSSIISNIPSGCDGYTYNVNFISSNIAGLFSNTDDFIVKNVKIEKVSLNSTSEQWSFTLSDGTIVTKNIVLKEVTE